MKTIFDSSFPFQCTFHLAVIPLNITVLTKYINVLFCMHMHMHACTVSIPSHICFDLLDERTNEQEQEKTMNRRAKTKNAPQFSFCCLFICLLACCACMRSVLFVRHFCLFFFLLHFIFILFFTFSTLWLSLSPCIN